MCNKIAIMIKCGGLRRIGGIAAAAFVISLPLSAQIAIQGVTVSATQAILQYTSPVPDPCSLQVADMNRAISITSVAQANGLVTVQTAAPHGLLAGAVVYLENSGAWNGWQVLTAVPSTTSFVFANAALGGVSGGNAGVLVDDVNPALFSGANLDSRVGSISTGQTTGPGHSSRGLKTAAEVVRLLSANAAPMLRSMAIAIPVPCRLSRAIISRSRAAPRPSIRTFALPISLWATLLTTGRRRSSQSRQLRLSHNSME